MKNLMQKQGIESPTLEEAQARWRKWVRPLLTPDQRKDFVGKRWGIIDGYPAAIGKTLTLYFYKNGNGEIYASFLTPSGEVGP